MFTHNLYPPQCQQQSIKHRNVDITSYRIEIEPGSDCFDCEIPGCGRAGGHEGALAQHTDWPQIDTCHVGTPYRVCHQGLIITLPPSLKNRCVPTPYKVKKKINLLCQKLYKIHELTSYVVKSLTKSMNLQDMLSKSWINPRNGQQGLLVKRTAKIKLYQQNKLKDTY